MLKTGRQQTAVIVIVGPPPYTPRNGKARRDCMSVPLVARIELGVSEIAQQHILAVKQPILKPEN